MPDPALNFHKIAGHPNELNWGENHIAVVEVKGKKICVGRFNDRLFAFAHKCPHAGGSMAAGWIDAMGNVVCPLHRYRFSLENGRNTSGEGYYLKRWTIKETTDGVFIEMPEEKRGWLF